MKIFKIVLLFEIILFFVFIDIMYKIFYLNELNIFVLFPAVIISLTLILFSVFLIQIKVGNYFSKITRNNVGNNQYNTKNQEGNSK